MEPLSLDELMNRIRDQVNEPVRPGCYYSRVADSVFCHLEDVPYRAEPVDEVLTVYLAEDDGRLVGAQIKGASKLPTHDVLRLDLGRREDVQLVELVLLTFQTTPSEAEAARRKATYFDVARSLQGLSIPATELQRA